MTRKILSIILASIYMFTPLMPVKAEEVRNQHVAVKKEVDAVRLQDDFYQAVNKDWLANAHIKPGYTESSAMTDLTDKSDANVRAIFDEILAKESTYKNNDTEKKMINLYKNELNWEARNKQGCEPIKKYLEQIDKVQTIEEFSKLLQDEEISLFDGLINMGIDQDIQDSTQNVLYIGSSSLQLEDADHYTMPSEMATKMKQALDEYNQKILELVGYSKNEAKQIIENVYKLESVMAPFIMGTKEINAHLDYYRATYNEYTIKELEALAPNLGLKKLLKANGVDKAKKIIVEEPKWLRALNSLYTQEHLELLKDYLKLNLIQDTSGCLTKEFEEAHDLLKAKLLGVNGKLTEEEIAFQTVNTVFSNALGKEYVERYFSPEAKADVEKMIDEIIAKYGERISNLEWMGDSTKKNATQKLEAIKVKVGYPKKWEDYKKLEVKTFEEGSSLFENNLSVLKYLRDKQVNKLNKPVDRDKFSMPPQMVNAYYNPSNNEIVFPAGILQAPYYDINQSKEANLGGIGAVIGHEISHAFDNSGARFDKDGNLNNWWTYEDYKVFEKKEKAVREYYNHVEVSPGKCVDGNLTVGENIADIGGLACVIDILNDNKNADFKAFFNNWATIWRGIQSSEYAAYLLTVDAHSPYKVRVNEAIKQFEEFYKTYGITEKDGMYLAPEKRLGIW